jgi:predicted phosphate transport protein (TIGR00153 family)
MLFKKKDFFFATLMLSAQNLKEASELFLEEINNLHAVEEYAKKIKDLELKGDDYTHDIIHALNKTFITPLEREDILGLATKIDDVIDGIEECADRLCLYQVKQADEYIVAFAENIVKSCHEIVAAMALLEQKKLPEMMQHVFRINELENEADSLLRVCIRNLFEKTDDPILIIKKMQLYDMLERITDVCEDVADILESLQMRNS